MNRLFAAACVGCLGLVLVANSGMTGDKDKKTEGKFKGMLPAGWKALKLSTEQTQAIYAVQKTFKSRLAALEEQITELKTQERAEMVKVLNEDQKSLLRKLTIGEGGKGASKKIEKDK